MFTRALQFSGKIALAGLAFLAGQGLFSAVLQAVGMAAPIMPGIDLEATARLQPVMALAIAAALVPLALRLSGGFAFRWLALPLFAWVAYALNTYLEARIFSPVYATPFELIAGAGACLLATATLAALFRPAPPRSLAEDAPAFWRQFGPAGWAWRLVVAWLAFPLIYLIFGMIVAPVVTPYYQADANLTIPGFDVILPTLALRSGLYLLSILPLLAAWRGSRLGLAAALGLALFVLAGGGPLLVATWYAPALRVAHSIELLGDALVYSGLLALLVVRKSQAPVLEHALLKGTTL